MLGNKNMTNHNTAEATPKLPGSRASALSLSHEVHSLRGERTRTWPPFGPLAACDAARAGHPRSTSNSNGTASSSYRRTMLALVIGELAPTAPATAAVTSSRVRWSIMWQLAARTAAGVGPFLRTVQAAEQFCGSASFRGDGKATARPKRVVGSGPSLLASPAPSTPHCPYCCRCLCCWR